MTIQDTARRAGGDLLWDKLLPAHREWQRLATNHRSPEARRAEQVWRDLEQQARERFAAESGWVITGRPFSLAQLRDGRAARRRDDYVERCVPHLALDHPEYFRWPGRAAIPAGIVVHVYARNYEQCFAFAAARGLAFWPLWDSWYFPSHARAGCYTRAAPSARILTFPRGRA